MRHDRSRPPPRALGGAISVPREFGVVQKVVSQSQPVDAQILRQLINELKSNAQTYVNQTKQFLLHNQTTYTLYIGSENVGGTAFKMFKG